MTSRKEQLAAYWPVVRAMPVLWTVFGLLIGGTGALFTVVRTLDAAAEVPRAVEAHSDSIRAHSARMDGLEARYSSNEAILQDVHCLVAAMAHLDGYTQTGCALRVRPQPRQEPGIR